jgi:hypothetical protein
MILPFRMIVEKYPKSNEVASSSILVCEIFSLFDGKNTLTMMFSVTASKVLLDTNCKPQYCITTTKMLTQQWLSFLVSLWGIKDYSVAITITCQVDFIQISIIHDNISQQVADKRRKGSGQWMNSSIIHDNICSLIHRNCHPYCFHIDIKYHMALHVPPLSPPQSGGIH